MNKQEKEKLRDQIYNLHYRWLKSLRKAKTSTECAKQLAQITEYNEMMSKVDKWLLYNE